MNLNPEQQKAAEKTEGPLLIIAWAGSGKTATLTARIAHMISEKNITPSSILAVTFTNKAASEMKERIGKSIGMDISNAFRNPHIPYIGTFHSFWVFILKEVLWNTSIQEKVTNVIGIKKDFIIYDESDKLSIMKGIIKNDLWLIEKEYPPRQIAYYISDAKNKCITAEMYGKEVDTHIKEVVNDAYTRYEKKLRENNALDFDDILVKTLQILENIPEILDHYQERYKYLMVDEYQDTNIPQYKIVKLLASRYKNLAVVGDDWQSIYSWRGADMRNILNFQKDYPQALIVKLEQNYRSTKKIIESANAIIKNNKDSLKKELWTDNDSGENIIYGECYDDGAEANWIAENIKEHEGDLKDNLILYRTNSQSRKIEEALLKNNLPYRVVGGMKFYDRKEIKDILSYLKILHNPNDVVSFKRIINTPSRKIGAKSIQVLDSYREQFGINYLQIIENIEEADELRNAAKIALTEFGNIYKILMEKSFGLEVSALISEIVKSIGYKEYLQTEFSKEEVESKQDNLVELENVASEYNGMNPRESLSMFLEEVALITDMDTKDERQDYVTLMTIHTSKWLEQKRVFVSGLEEGIFPHNRSITDPKQLEEERRLMYVAMTRAEQELFLSRAKERFYFGDYIRNPASRFLKEIPEELLIKEEVGSNSFSGFSTSFSQGLGESTIGTFATQKPKVSNNVSDFSMWDKVHHHKFWNGIITSLNGELAEIAFPGKGMKKMNIRIAPVKKI